MVISARPAAVEKAAERVGEEARVRQTRPIAPRSCSPFVKGRSVVSARSSTIRRLPHCPRAVPCRRPRSSTGRHHKPHGAFYPADFQASLLAITGRPSSPIPMRRSAPPRRSTVIRSRFREVCKAPASMATMPIRRSSFRIFSPTRNTASAFLPPVSMPRLCLAPTATLPINPIARPRASRCHLAWSRRKPPIRS